MDIAFSSRRTATAVTARVQPEWVERWQSHERYFHMQHQFSMTTTLLIYVVLPGCPEPLP